MNEADKLILEQILEQCERIDDRIQKFEIDEDRFMDESAFFDMLLMPLFQIGELAGVLTDEFRTNCHSIPWHAIVGFRNVIAHDYGVVEPLWAWNTIQHDIPALRSFLMEELGC